MRQGRDNAHVPKVCGEQQRRITCVKCKRYRNEGSSAKLDIGCRSREQDLEP